MAVPTEEDEAEAELCAGPNHNKIIHNTVRVLQSRMFLNHKVVQLMCRTCLQHIFDHHKHKTPCRPCRRPISSFKGRSTFQYDADEVYTGY